MILTIRLTPKSGRDEIAGVGRLSDGRPILKARVLAAPQDGAANEALINLVAKSLRLPAAAVQLESGAAGRLKRLLLSGDAKELEGALIAVSERARA